MIMGATFPSLTAAKNMNVKKQKNTKLNIIHTTFITRMEPDILRIL